MRSVLSIKSRSPPPPGKSVNFEDFILICTVFPHFGPFFWGGGGVKPNFADKNFMDTQTFLTHTPEKVELSGPIAQYLFEIVLQRWVSHAFCLVSMWYPTTSIVEIPLLYTRYRLSKVIAEIIRKLLRDKLCTLPSVAQGTKRVACSLHHHSLAW